MTTPLLLECSKTRARRIIKDVHADLTRLAERYGFTFLHPRQLPPKGYMEDAHSILTRYSDTLLTIGRASHEPTSPVFTLVKPRNQ